MKKEDDSSTVLIILPLRVQHVLASLKTWLDLLRLASHTMKAQDPLESSAPSPALAFSTEHLSHPQSQPGTQPILQINSPTSNSETRATAIDHHQKKQSCDLKSYLVAAEMQQRRSTFHHSAKRLSAST